MITAKCPLRISLVGGSTDLQSFLEKYNNGSVVSFASNLYTYISINENKNEKYRINYTKTENVKDPSKIKGLVKARFDVPIPRAAPHSAT